MTKHSPGEQRERAVKMVLEHLDEYRSVYAACQAIGPKSGSVRSRCGGGCCKLRSMPACVPVPRLLQQQRIMALERENRDLTEANEILKSASIFFARELDPRHR